MTQNNYSIYYYYFLFFKLLRIKSIALVLNLLFKLSQLFPLWGLNHLDVSKNYRRKEAKTIEEKRYGHLLNTVLRYIMSETQTFIT